MRIQHNIMAMSAYRNYTNNVSAMKKNLEKLSSGYKINRAGDDAAGLAISEKMRAQITGLETAQKNAKDGISLVQTAEGALTEVHDMLNRMVELATQSANGTYDNDTDRAQLQKEVDQLRTEIDRIADSANFNGINLLDGSMADGVTRTNTTGGDVTDVPILQNVATNPTQEVGKATVLHKDAPKEGPTIITAELHNVEVKGQAGDTVKFSIGGTDIELAVKSTGATPNALLGELTADKAYGGADLANMVAKAFKNGAATIAGQAFKVEANGSTLTFTQASNPTSQDEIVDANLPVTVSIVNNPAGQTMEYSFKIDNNAINAGGKFTIGDMEFKVLGTSATSSKGNIVATLKGTAGTDTSIANKTLANGYVVSYKSGTLTIKDAKGDLGKPEVVYDTYGSKESIASVRTVGKKAIAADTQAKATTISIDGEDTFTIDGTTFEINTSGAKFAKKDGTAITASAVASTANFTLKIEDGSIVVTAKASAADGTKTNGTKGNGIKVDYSITHKGETDSIEKTLELTGGIDKQNATKSRTEYDLSGLKDGDKITIGGKDYIFDTSLANTLNGKLGAKASNAVGSASLKVSLDGDTLVVENTAAGETAAYSGIVTVEKKQDTTATLKETGKANSMVGTWNVQTTKNTQGASANAGQLASTTFDLTADMIKDGNSLTIGNATYTFKVGKDSTVTGDNVIDLSNVDEADLIKEAGKALANQDNEAFTIGYSPDASVKTISIHEKEGQSVYTKGELNTVESFDKLVYCQTASVTENTVEGKSLTLQIGPTSDNFNQLKVDIKDCHTDAIGIADIDISTQEGAAAAVDKIKAAINYVSDVRGTLGATQNRLDHTINNLSVMTENIQDAESTIRDVDVAEEMMAYTKNNILIQSAQAMLAQANQVPQGVLQLLG